MLGNSNSNRLHNDNNKYKINKFIPQSLIRITIIESTKQNKKAAFNIYNTINCNNPHILENCVAPNKNRNEKERTK